MNFGITDELHLFSQELAFKTDSRHYSNFAALPLLIQELPSITSLF